MRRIPLRLSLIWHSYLFIWLCGACAPVWPAAAITGGCFILLADKRLWHVSRLILAILLFSFAFLITWRHFTNVRQTVAHAPAWRQDVRKAIRFCGDVISVQGLPDNRLRLLLDETRLQDQASTQPLPGLCAWTWEKPPAGEIPLPGMEVCLTRPIKRVRAIDPARGSGFDTAWLAKDIYWRVWSREDKGDPQTRGKPSFAALAREKARERFMAALAPDSIAKGEYTDAAGGFPQAKAILPALLFGDRRYLTRQTVDNFAAATLAHSLALSGQHLAIAGLGGLCLILAIARIRPTIYLARPKIWLITMASWPLAMLYLWLGNAPPSLIRAASMLSIFVFWLWRGLVFSGTDLLCAALALILIFNPLAFFDIGMQLSLLCVGIIALGAPALTSMGKTRDHERPNAAQWLGSNLTQIFMISLLIQLAMLPISLARFDLAGFWFPFNLLWLPALALIVLPLAAIGLLLAAILPQEFLVIASLCLDLASLPCALLLEILNWMRANGFLAEPAFLLPHWFNILAFTAIALGLAWFFGNRQTAKINARARVLFCCALALLALGPCLRLKNATSPDIKLTAVDVGQAQAIVINSPGAAKMLIDGGGGFGGAFDPGKNIISPRIRANSPPSLEAVVNTHPDMDHLGGLFHILEKFNPAHVFHNGREAAGASRARWASLREKTGAKTLVAGDVIILGDERDNLRLEVLHPPAETPRSDLIGHAKWRGNSASIVMRLTQNGVGLALFPGDAELATLKHLLDSGQDLRARVLFAPHHGSDRSYWPTFYKAVDPRILVVSCGFENIWNYPGKKVSAWFAKKGVPVLDTGTRGEIGITFTHGGKMLVDAAEDRKD